MRIASLTAIVLSLAFCSTGLGQNQSGYRFHRQIEGVSETWHKIILPSELVGKLSPSLSDLRILGITAKHDTVEAPYIIRMGSESVALKEINFKIINQSHNAAGYFFTFEVPGSESLNTIRLEFAQQNFDWRINLQGSHDNSQRFTLTENYRILSLNNSLTQYKFTEVAFPEAQYRYLRVQILAKEQPKLLSAKLISTTVTKGSYYNYATTKLKVSNNKEAKQTVATTCLTSPMPVSYVRLWVKEKFDYYRPITIDYISDSIITQKGKIYSYQTLYSGTLTSLEKSIFKFDNRVTKNLRITIENHDNQPLSIDSIEVKGNIYELVARFTQPANYFLAYGDLNASSPTYDIEQFIDKIPAQVKDLTLGNETERGFAVKKAPKPLFQNKLWLWLTIGVIGALMGWFTLKMMRQK